MADLPERCIVYVGDPVCSWCWGFSEVLRQLVDRFGEQVPFVAVMGGLRPGPSAEPLDDRMRGFLRHHWEEVHARTGQPVAYEFLERTERLVLDTEIPCRAVVAVRALAPAQTLAYFRAVQQALFTENRNIFAAEPLADIAAEHGVPRASFMDSFASDSMREQTAADFQLARQLGVHGFPSLLVRDASGYKVATYGYTPLEALEPALSGWLAESAAQPTAGGA